MYPSVGEFGRAGSSAQGSTSQSPYNQSEAPRWQTPQPSAQNGPSPPAAAGNFPMLRVQIAEQYRTFPPVMINSGLEDIPRTQFSYDFEYEQQLIRRLQSEQAGGSSSRPKPDTLQPTVNRFTELGYTREEVTLALAGVGGKEDEVVEFVRNYKELLSMGFDSASVVGALVLHKSDLTAATDACLAAQSSQNSWQHVNSAFSFRLSLPYVWYRKEGRKGYICSSQIRAD